MRGSRVPRWGGPPRSSLRARADAPPPAPCGRTGTGPGHGHGSTTGSMRACRRQGITLRRRGQEHCGPCQICQTDDDRFWIKPGRVQPGRARCRHGHTYRQLHRALLGDSFDTPVRPRRRRPAGVAAHRARRLFAVAHRGRPTYFRRKFPNQIGSSGRTATCGSCR